MIKLLIKFAIGVLAIPLAMGISIAFYKNMLMVKDIAANLGYFAWGIAAYTAFHVLFYRPTYLYVLGHEAVHAGVAWIFGGKIKSFKVSKEGGGVGTDKSNFVIELSPYFIPIYAIVIAFIYIVVASSYHVSGRAFFFLMGLALAFHLISTVEVMKIRQPDIMKSGYLFSVVLIYILNIAVISIIFGMIFPSFSAKKFFIDTGMISKDVYLRIVKQLFF